MTAGDRIAGVALMISIGVLLNFTFNARFQSLDAVLEAYEDRLDRLDSRDGRVDAVLAAADDQVDEVLAVINEIPGAIAGLPGLTERVAAIEDALRVLNNRFEQLENNQTALNRRLIENSR